MQQGFVRGKRKGISEPGEPHLICLQLLNGFLCIGLCDNSDSRCSITKAVRMLHREGRACTDVCQAVQLT